MNLIIMIINSSRGSKVFGFPYKAPYIINNGQNLFVWTIDVWQAWIMTLYAHISMQERLPSSENIEHIEQLWYSCSQNMANIVKLNIGKLSVVFIS